MPYVPVQDLLARTDSIYKLVVLASKRAVELNAGAPRLVEADGEKVSSIALEEIAQGRVKFESPKHGTKPKRDV
ncbi:MAG: DNA-directed RNA polymerase subunit omega [Candidatus Omnitrophica bacterium]|nr:DNA-directed RNA polymerase subunit omega [Candidatus Omnitrophota bacterium]